MADDCRVSSSKAKANALMKQGKYLAAIDLYTRGIELQPANPVLYSNRSLAFLKLQKYFFALKDAEITISLVPDWNKGHYRKGQAQQAAGRYDMAILTYENGLKSCPSNGMLMKSLKEAKGLQEQFLTKKKRTQRCYMVATAVAGCLLVVCDMWQRNTIIRYAWIRAMIITFSSFAGYLIGSLIAEERYLRNTILLQPPTELLVSGANAEQKDQSCSDSKCSSTGTEHSTLSDLSSYEKKCM